MATLTARAGGTWILGVIIMAAKAFKTVTWDNRGPHKQGGLRGLLVGTGQLLISGSSSAFQTSQIEKSFRRIRDITFNVELGMVGQFIRSTTHKAGQLNTYAQAATSTGVDAEGFLSQQAPTSGTVITFTAFGI